MLFVVFTTLETKVIISTDDFTPVKSDAVLILGHSLIDGLIPDTYLTERLEKGLELYNNQLCDYIILSGGQGPTDTIPVAEAMKTWLIERNIPPDVIITETSSKNTYENMRYTKEIIKSYKDINSIIVVTSDFHIYRSVLIANNIFDNVTGSVSKSRMSINTVLLYVKEPFSIIKYYIEREFY